MAAYRRVDDLRSPAGWLPVHRDQLQAQRSVSSMGSLYLTFYVRYVLLNIFIYLHANVTECTQCKGSAYEVRPCTPTTDRHCLRKSSSVVFVNCNLNNLTHLYICICCIANMRLVQFILRLTPVRFPLCVFCDSFIVYNVVSCYLSLKSTPWGTPVS